VIRFRSDPDHWARYFRVQRMIGQLQRVEREAAEKLRQQTEISEKPHPPGKAAITRKSPRGLHRPTSVSSALKVFVFGSASGHSGTDPSPLLSNSRGTEMLSLKSSRSAGGRLDECGGAESTDRPQYPVTAPCEGLSRTHSFGSTGRVRKPGKLELTRSPATLQVPLSDE